jgi:hypothetical protein
MINLSSNVEPPTEQAFDTIVSRQNLFHKLKQHT